MRYELLGQFRICDESGSRPVPGPKIATVLAALLARADEVVTVDELITEVWGASPPRRSVATLYVYISQVRKLLDRRGDGESRVLTCSGGYKLRSGSDESDLWELRRLLRQGRAEMEAGRIDEAAEVFELALGLWQGADVSGPVGGPILNVFLRWLGEVRIECLEKFAECSLRAGRHHESIALLRNLVGEYPMHEGFHELLMTALARCGRRADALAAYRSAREVLRAELGLEPGEALQNLHQNLLAADVPRGPSVLLRPVRVPRGHSSLVAGSAGWPVPSAQAS